MLGFEHTHTIKCFTGKNITTAHSFSMKQSSKNDLMAWLSTAEMSNESTRPPMLQRLEETNCSIISHPETYSHSIIRIYRCSINGEQGLSLLEQ